MLYFIANDMKNEVESDGAHNNYSLCNCVHSVCVCVCAHAHGCVCRSSPLLPHVIICGDQSFGASYKVSSGVCGVSLATARSPKCCMFLLLLVLLYEDLSLRDIYYSFQNHSLLYFHLSSPCIFTQIHNVISVLTIGFKRSETSWNLIFLNVSQLLFKIVL